MCFLGSPAFEDVHCDESVRKMFSDRVEQHAVKIFASSGDTLQEADAGSCDDIL